MTKARDLGDFISDGTIAETVTADGLDLGDNERIRLGASQDLQILHNGLHSYIADSGTGNLYIQTTAGLIVQNSAGTETLATFTENGSVDLYYDNSVKVATSSTGATVTGTIAVSDSFNATSGTFTVQSNGTDILNVTSTVMSPQTDGAISLGSSSNGFNELHLDGTAKVGGSILQGTDTTTVYYNSVNTYNASTVIKTSVTNELTDLVLTNGDNNFGSALDFARTNSASNDVRYAALAGVADSNTAGSEAGYLKFSTKGASDSNIQERMRISADGRVGIGTASPNTNLSIYSDTDSSINVNHSSSGGTYPKKSGISFGGTATSLGGDLDYRGGAGIQAINTAASGAPTDLMFWTNLGGTPSESVRIKDNGWVGIGTSSPETALEVKGTGSSIAGLNTHALLSDETAMAANVGGGVLFEGNYTTGGDDAVFAGIKSLKENGTSGNYAGALAFYSRANGSLPAERFRIGSSGELGIGGATYGTSGQVLTSGGSGAAPTWADASSGGMTEITSGTIGSNAQYNFSLGSNWWNTYKYVKVIYLATFQSGDPPSGTYHCQFRLNSVSTSIYTYSGQRGSTDNAGTATAGRLTIGSPQDNHPVFIEAEIYTDGTHTFVSASSGGGQSNGGGFANTLVSNQTPTTFNIIQDATGSERYRFEGDITFYGVN